MEGRWLAPLVLISSHSLPGDVTAMSLDAAGLAEVERTCEVRARAAAAATRGSSMCGPPPPPSLQAYMKGTAGSAHGAVQEQLLSLGSSVEHLDFLQTIFSRSTNSSAIAVAAISLTRLVTDFWTSFAEGDRVSIRCVGPRVRAPRLTCCRRRRQQQRQARGRRGRMGRRAGLSAP